MVVPRLFSLLLSPQDERLLANLATMNGATRSDVVRWALRYYAVAGPWTDEPADRVKVCGGKDVMLAVGPFRVEVDS